MISKFLVLSLALLALIFITGCQQNHYQAKDSFKDMLLEQLLVDDLEKLKLTLPSDRVKTIHQGNLTAEEDKQLRKIASSRSEEEIKEKTGNTITKQEYLSLWSQEG
jgi:competence protein ComGF